MGHAGGTNLALHSLPFVILNLHILAPFNCTFFCVSVEFMSANRKIPCYWLTAVTYQTLFPLFNSCSHQLTVVLLFIHLAILILIARLAQFSSKIFLELELWEH